MDIKAIDNTTFNGFYKIPVNTKNMFEIRNYVFPAITRVKRTPVVIFSGNNPFKLILKYAMKCIADNNNGSIEWLKMNAANHGLDINDDGEDVLNIITTQKDIDNLIEYISKRINSRKPKFMDKVKSFIGIKESNPNYEKLPEHLKVLSDFLKADKEEIKAFSSYTRDAVIVDDARELLKRVLTEPV